MWLKFPHILSLLLPFLLSVAVERIEKEADLRERVIVDCKNSSRSPEETILWFKDGEPIPRYTNQSTLRINYVQKWDIGSYKCIIIKNNNGSKEKLVNDVIIKLRFFPPEINEALPSVKTFEIGSKGELLCVVAGNPIPDIDWYFDWKILDDRNDKYAIKVEEMDRGVTSYLTINNLQMEDGGSYRCEASSNQSVARHTMELKISPNLTRINDHR